MADAKYVVAGIRNYFGGTGEQGVMLGEFRELEFARKARSAMVKEAQRKKWTGRRGIFLNGKFVEEL